MKKIFIVVLIGIVFLFASCKGRTGEDGTNGDRGATGSVGALGLLGPTGITLQGETGGIGLTGATGPSGLACDWGEEADYNVTPAVCVFVEPESCGGNLEWSQFHKMCAVPCGDGYVRNGIDGGCDAE